MFAPPLRNGLYFFSFSLYFSVFIYFYFIATSNALFFSAVANIYLRNMSGRVEVKKEGKKTSAELLSEENNQNRPDRMKITLKLVDEIKKSKPKASTEEKETQLSGSFSI